MGGSAQKQKFDKPTFFFLSPIKPFLRHFALFATLLVAFVNKFFMNKGFAERFAGERSEEKNEKGRKRTAGTAVLHEESVEFV